MALAHGEIKVAMQNARRVYVTGGTTCENQVFKKCLEQKLSEKQCQKLLHACSCEARVSAACKRLHIPDCERQIKRLCGKHRPFKAGVDVGRI